MLDVLRWTVATPLAIFAILTVAASFACLMAAYQERRAVSFFPLVGGLAGAACLLLCPAPGAVYWAWVPLVIDPGCGLALAVLAYQLWKGNRD
jgi:hypothetical protein